MQLIFIDSGLNLIATTSHDHVTKLFRGLGAEKGKMRSPQEESWLCVAGFRNDLLDLVISVTLCGLSSLVDEISRSKVLQKFEVDCSFRRRKVNKAYNYLAR
jgi:hypothetical protein